ncbi:hypothetical protein FRC12_011351 [Ceratobasidium sp. 428]|nr:hypothetical protein FRC09_019205 [Ceratobasidium sp. 395]KAG8754002.1 hypothetical protein FRC12_011351 [Ceratobasidium sp. 428]
MGVVYSTYKETFPGKPRWSIDQIPDLTGQVIIVTGGNAGIGRETCKVLLNKGAKVYMAARSKSKADEAIEWLKAETGGKAPEFLQLDLADLTSVRRAVEEFKQKEEKLDVLFNNGGVMMPPIEMKTATDYDIQFGTNVLGHYLFTTLLLPVLIHTAQTSPRGHVRVVNTSSNGHRFAPKGGIDYSTLTPNDTESEARRRKMGTTTLYAQSKWGNVVFANELARRYESQGIISTSLHPGIIKTELQRHMTLGGIQQAILNSLLWPAPYGALTQLYAGTASEGANFSGKYLAPWAKVSKARADTRDEEAGRKLWAWLEEQVKLN